MHSGFGLIISLGLVSAMGAGAGSFSVLIGAAAQRLPADARGAASGVINAGGSFGQFVFAPLSQRLIQTIGWMGAMWTLAAITLAALPLIASLTRARPANPASSPITDNTNNAKNNNNAIAANVPGPQTLKQAVSQALREPSYLLLHLGFFTCGFHIAFLVTHLPSEVNLCGLSAPVASWSLAIIGLANIVGSLLAGSWVNRYRSKYVLALMYGSRALLVGVYLLAPKTELTFYLFAIGLGLTWLATVPPTAAIVGKLFGIRYLATLFGLTLLSHQIGGFLGAYLGGLALSHFGDYQWMWYADMALALLAAIINLPIREAPIVAIKA
ncbi:MAG: Oxalate:formate antiporter, partial [Pseudomonadota bacterium]